MTLHLTLHRKWYDLILSGKKTIEYREANEYWRTRIEGRQYDNISFRNGYHTNARKLTVKYLGWSWGMFAGKKCYALKLGDFVPAGHPAGHQ